MVETQHDDGKVMPLTRDWHAHWNGAPQIAESDPLKQVGKTVAGVPVSRRLVSLIAEAIAERLNLRSSSSLLELCCGNGLITCLVAEKCRSIVAVDFSAALIATARRNFARPNITYLCGDAVMLDESLLARGFDGIFMQEALQHFTSGQSDALLSLLSSSPARPAPVYFGSVPDKAKLRTFYDTPERYSRYLETAEAGCEPIGTWWDRTEILALAERHGYRAAIFDQHPDLHTAHYRFDALFARG